MSGLYLISEFSNLRPDVEKPSFKLLRIENQIPPPTSKLRLFSKSELVNSFLLTISLILDL